MMKRFAAFGAGFAATLALSIALAQQSTVSGVPGRLKLQSLTVAGLNVGGVMIVEKANFTSRANTTTVTDDPDLILTGLVASARYHVVMQLTAVNATTTTQGIKIRLHYTGTMASGGQCQRTFGAVGVYAVGTTGMNFDQSYSSISTAFDVIQYDCFFTSQTAGTLSVRWAQNASSANNTSVSGPSYLMVERIS